MCEKLDPYSHKWREIATKLHFSEDELLNIEHTPRLFHGAPHSYLREILHQWLQCTPGDARSSPDYATLESLKRAVDRAGLPIVAQNLKL